MQNIPNLKVYEDAIYKATYCGLCKKLKKKFGNLSRLNLNYDMVFFTIFSICYLQEDFQFEKKFCKLHPFKKKLCLKDCVSLEKAADVSIILFYFKIKDNILDSKKIKKTLNYAALLLLKRAYNKAKHNSNYIANLVSNFVKKQSEVEKTPNMPIEYYAHPTSECMGEIFKSLKKSKKETEILYRIGYMLGKYIYLMDALDDLAQDVKNNNFNPVLQSNIKNSNNNAIKTIDQLLNFTIAQLASSFEELKIKSYVQIIQNIIYLGLKNSKKLILNKHKKLFTSLMLE